MREREPHGGRLAHPELLGPRTPRAEELGRPLDQAREIEHPDEPVEAVARGVCGEVGELVDRREDEGTSGPRAALEERLGGERATEAAVRGEVELERRQLVVHEGIFDVVADLGCDEGTVPERTDRLAGARAIVGPDEHVQVERDAIVGRVVETCGEGRSLEDEVWDVVERSADAREGVDEVRAPCGRGLLPLAQPGDELGWSVCAEGARAADDTEQAVVRRCADDGRPRGRRGEQLLVSREREHQRHVDGGRERLHARRDGEPFSPCASRDPAQ